MKYLIITACIIVSFAACTTKETTKETVTTETTAPMETSATQNIPATPPPAPEKQNRVEAVISDSGSSIKIKLP